jgi:hypothetical protein
MIVWGGSNKTGGRYNPATDSWASDGTSMINAPNGYGTHTAIWTGSEMIIWGGITDPFGYTNTGGRYNPSDDTWAPNGTSVIDAPLARSYHTAIWTGSEMIVWGGLWGDGLNTGGRYNPSTDSWASGGTSITNAPSGRTEHRAVWTGTEMIIWGGSVTPGGSVLNTGGRYNPSSDSWALGGTTEINAPTARTDNTAIWTGTEMIVWGGIGNDDSVTNTGGRYNPSSDTWTATSNVNVPAARYRHSVIWTGDEMIVWGGNYSGIFATATTNTGGRYCVANGGLSISDVLVEEGKKGSKTLKFVVSLSTPLDFTVKFDYATADGTATEAGNDYIAKSGTKRIRRGETTTTVKIKIRGDKIAEADEAFTVNLTNAVGVGIADPQGVGTIINDD